MTPHRLTYLALWVASTALYHQTHGLTRVATGAACFFWGVSYVLVVIHDVAEWRRKRQQAREVEKVAAIWNVAERS